jgi:hypothetical protein
VTGFHGQLKIGDRAVGYLAVGRLMVERLVMGRLAMGRSACDILWFSSFGTTIYLSKLCQIVRMFGYSLQMMYHS